MEKRELFTVTVYSENRVGLLSLISNTFTRRKLNIETLSVSPSSIEGLHKFTITVETEHSTLVKLVKQIEKRIDVLKAFYYRDDEIVFQEIALYKVQTDLLTAKANVEEIVRRYGLRVLEMKPEYVVFEKTGHHDETQALFEELKQVGLRQFVRSGRVAVTRSTAERVSEFLSQRAQSAEENKDELLHQ